MLTVFLSTLVGVGLGAAFTFLKLPLPAPVSFAGVMGVVGVWAGYQIVTRFVS